MSKVSGHVLAGGGECGELARSLDWSATPLGPVERWPSSLKTAAMTCLESRFGLCLFWGPELITIYNDAYAPMLGGKHPAMGAPLSTIWPEIWDQIGPMLDAVVRTATPTWSEDQMLLLDRNGFLEAGYFTYSFSPVRDETGEVAGVFTAVHETTSRVVSTRRLQTLTGLAERMAAVHSREGVAHAAAGVLAEAPEDVPFAVLYLLDDAGGVQGASVVGAVAPQRWERAAQDSADGERVIAVAEPGIDVRTAVVLPVSAPGSTRPTAALVLGVNPRRALDEDHRRFFRSIAHQVASALASAAGYAAAQARGDALAELDRAKTEFFSNVSHEFRTPLMLMLGPLADALEDAAADPAVQHERVAIANRGALRMLRLVNALLDFSRVEAGRASARFVKVDLARVVSESASVFRAAAERSGLELRVEVADGDHGIDADPEMLEKIVLNLISNAYKFTFEGAIDIRVRGGERAIIEIADTGVGVPDGELPRLFERFHRVEGTRGRSNEGSGIGLALAHELVALHGGEISVTSELGKGTTFRVELPRHQAGAQGHTPADATLAETQRATFREEALRWDSAPEITAEPAVAPKAELLIADDNADLRAYLARLLGASYSVRTAVDGEDALAQLRERRADLVLTDVMMPGLDGFALLAKLREDQRTRRIPVILLSAQAGQEATVRGLEAGADDYLVKPFSAAELLARVKGHLELVRLRDALATGERDRAKEMENIALTLQRSLLPRAMPDVQGVSLAYRYIPAGGALEVGGDFYDATELDDGRVAIAIGDVAGHGVLAAAVMGQVRQTLRAYTFGGHRPAALIQHLDRLMLDADLTMTTCLCGILDPATGLLEFTNAGHPPPLIRRTGGAVERLEGALGPPLGVMIGWQRVEGQVQLAVGDALLLYTDGLVERRDEPIDWSIDQLARRFGAASRTPEAICEAVVAALEPRLADDVAVLALVRD